MIKFTNKFSENLKMLRVEHNLSQEELGKALNISRSVIGMYETGARKPSFETQELIADYFNVRLDDLLGRGKNKELSPLDIKKKALIDMVMAIDNEEQLLTLQRIVDAILKEN